MTNALLKDFDVLSRQEQQEALALLDRYKKLEKQDSCQHDFISFIKSQWPDFVEGRHHKIIGEKFNKIAQGKLKRLIVCLPPRHTKSEFASTFFPAWMMGLRGNLKIIQTTHTAELAVRFGRRVRNIIDSDEYKEVFPQLKLQADNKSAGRWTTNQGGESFSERTRRAQPYRHGFGVRMVHLWSTTASSAGRHYRYRYDAMVNQRPCWKGAKKAG